MRPQWRTHQELCSGSLLCSLKPSHVVQRRRPEARRRKGGHQPAGQSLHPAEQHRDCLGPIDGGFAVSLLWFILEYYIPLFHCSPSWSQTQHGSFSWPRMSARSWGDFSKNKRKKKVLMTQSWPEIRLISPKIKQITPTNTFIFLASAWTLNALASSFSLAKFKYIKSPPSSWRNPFID